jgi:hypothetical protein
MSTLKRCTVSIAAPTCPSTPHDSVPVFSSPSCCASPPPPNTLLALPSALHRMVLSHLCVADCVCVDLTCRHLQTAARSAVPATQTLRLDAAADAGNRRGPSGSLAPIPSGAVLRFLPRCLKIATGVDNVTPRSIALVCAVRAGVAADAARGVRRLYALETAGLCWCDLTVLLPLLPVVSALRVRRVSRLPLVLLSRSRADARSGDSRRLRRRVGRDAPRPLRSLGEPVSPAVHPGGRECGRRRLVYGEPSGLW